MNKFSLVFLSALLFAIVLARPAEDELIATAKAARAARPDPTTTTTQATILRQVDINNPDGSYNSSYETSNGIKVENIGYMKKILVPRLVEEDGKIIEEHEELILVQTGSYTYIDPDGKTITLRYIADENGFQPEGDHLPVPVQ